MRIVSTDISSTTDENQTRVILSTCESSSSCRESAAAVDAPDVAPPSRRKCSCPSRPLTTSRCAPFRRRVSFNEAAVIRTDDRCRHATTIMQNDGDSTSLRRDAKGDNNNGERETYDIWQADDSSTGRSDDGCSESAPRIDNYAENYCISDCTSNKGQLTHSSANIDELAIGNDEREGWIGKNDVCQANRVNNNTRKVDEEDIISNEDLSNFIHKDSTDEYRMRGGCNRCYCGARENVRRSPQDHNCCCCGGFASEPSESCTSNAKTACIVASRCCCRCPRMVCKKTARCDALPCTTGPRSCGSGGSCSSGCRDDCGKPGQICAPSPRICNSPARSLSQGSSPRASRCPPQSPCCISSCRSCCSGAFYKCGSPKCLSIIGGGCCINDGAKCGTDGVTCRLRSPCECLGGGLDCRRCERKVYQAEMQIVSGVPYHNTCFSCFCCRKPLEPLTYQENCGEIYCKQCYVRNFGPQGYGYGAGAGVLQTPL